MADNKQLPPGPPGIGFANLYHRLRDTLGWFLALRERYGDIVSFRIFFVRFCVMFDAELIDEVLVRQASSFHKGPAFKAVFENPTSGSADGAAHRRLRKLTQPVFFRQALEGYGEVIIEQAALTLQDWRDGATVDIEDVMKSHSQRVIAKTFFGRDVEFDPGVIKEIVNTLERIAILASLPLGKLLLRLRLPMPLPWSKRHNPYFKQLDDLIYTLVRNAREKNEARIDLVSLLAQATDEEGVEQPLTEVEVRDEAYAQMLAGHLPVAKAMTWCFYHLSRNPEVRAKMERELDEALQGGLPTVADYGKLTYTRAVFDESLRLSPPLHMLGRRAVADCTIGGYHVPKGTVVRPLVLAPHLEEKHYPQARQFRPERWLETTGQARAKLPYYPYGGGGAPVSGRISAGWKAC